MGISNNPRFLLHPSLFLSFRESVENSGSVDSRGVRLWWCGAWWYVLRIENA
jgi:hypothetical protein